jgi:hypothetical protein
MHKILQSFTAMCDSFKHEMCIHVWCNLFDPFNLCGSLQEVWDPFSNLTMYIVYCTMREQLSHFFISLYSKKIAL